MKIFLNKKKLIEIIQHEKNLGFVPTMGAIHKAHIYILKKVSLYVTKQLFRYLLTRPNLIKLPTTKSIQETLKKTYQYSENVKLIIFIYHLRNKYIHLVIIKKLK